MKGSAADAPGAAQRAGPGCLGHGAASLLGGGGGLRAASWAAQRLDLESPASRPPPSGHRAPVHRLHPARGSWRRCEQCQVSGRTPAGPEGGGDGSGLGAGLAGSRVHARPSSWRLLREARGRRHGRAMPCAPGSSPRARRTQGRGRRLPFHHAVSLPLFLLILALLGCLQLALGLAVVILGGQGPCGKRGTSQSLSSAGQGGPCGLWLSHPLSRVRLRAAGRARPLAMSRAGCPGLGRTVRLSQAQKAGYTH